MNRVPQSGREGWLKGNLAGQRAGERGEGLQAGEDGGGFYPEGGSRGWAALYVSDKPIWKSGESRSVVSDSLRPHGLYSPWNSPGQNTGVGSLSILQGIFPTQGSSPGLPRCRRILYQLSHQGSLEVGWGLGKEIKLGDLSLSRDKERGDWAGGAKGRVRG